MFKARDRAVLPAAVPTVLWGSCAADAVIPIEEAWEKVADPSLPLADTDFAIEGGWLPGHALTVGALRYAVRLYDEGAPTGELSQVTVSEPPRRLVLRRLEPGITKGFLEHEWNLSPLPHGVTVRLTLRAHLGDPSDALRRRVQAEIDHVIAFIEQRLRRSLES